MHREKVAFVFFSILHGIAKDYLIDNSNLKRTKYRFCVFGFFFCLLCFSLCLYYMSSSDSKS